MFRIYCLGFRVKGHRIAVRLGQEPPGLGIKDLAATSFLTPFLKARTDPRPKGQRHLTSDAFDHSPNIDLGVSEN